MSWPVDRAAPGGGWGLGGWGRYGGRRRRAAAAAARQARLAGLPGGAHPAVQHHVSTGSREPRKKPDVGTIF